MCSRKQGHSEVGLPLTGIVTQITETQLKESYSYRLVYHKGGFPVPLILAIQPSSPFLSSFKMRP